jgi:hypothetical protein
VLPNHILHLACLWTSPEWDVALKVQLKYPQSLTLLSTLLYSLFSCLILIKTAFWPCQICSFWTHSGKDKTQPCWQLPLWPLPLLTLTTPHPHCFIPLFSLPTSPDFHWNWPLALSNSSILDKLWWGQDTT